MIELLGGIFRERWAKGFLEKDEVRLITAHEFISYSSYLTLACPDLGIVCPISI